MLYLQQRWLISSIWEASLPTYLPEYRHDSAVPLTNGCIKAIFFMTESWVHPRQVMDSHLYRLRGGTK